MNKFLLTIGMLAIAMATVMAQGGTTWPLVTIRQVQEVPADSLTATPPRDRSLFHGDTVRVRGRLVTLPGQAFSSSEGRAARWVWIQSGTGPWSGINVRPPNSYTGPSTGTYDFSAGIPGDSVEVAGVINTFGNFNGNETQLEPFNITGGYVTLFPVATVAPQPTTIDACDLNDANGNWKATTGEQWEGVYVKLNNATVVSVPPIRPSNRQDFVVESNGCRVTIYATFNVMRTNASTVTNSVFGPNLTVYPNFVTPQVGDFYDSIWGMCNYVSDVGAYTISPWDTAQFKKGISQVPQISNVTQSVLVPTPTQSVTVTATINFSLGTPTAKLYYARGLNNMVYDSIDMVSGPNGYTATIPSVSDSAYVKYYITAFGGVIPMFFPVDAPANPKFYRIGTNGFQISDVQFTPFNIGTRPSPYLGDIVTVTGVVTASSADLERIFIQEEGKNTWAGVEVTGNLQLALLNIGDRATVTGLVQESNGFTRIGAVTAVSSSGTGTITPVELEPQVFATNTYTGETYEGMLVKLKSSDPAPNDSIYIIQNNADNISNFGEFRVGKDVSAPTVGSRVKTGRTNTEPASPNVCYLIPQANPAAVLNDTTCGIVVQVGQRMKSITGIMFFSFGNYKLYPRNNADFEDFSQAPLSIASIEEQDNQVMIYPNPTSYEVVIRVDNNIASNWTLLDVSGRTVKSERLNGQFSTVDLSGVQQGTYISVLTNALNGEILQRGKLMITK